MPAGIFYTCACAMDVAADYFFSKFYYTQSCEAPVKRSSYHGFN